MRATVDETELEALVQRLRDGDDSVSERLILYFLGLGRSLSRHAVAQHPDQADDIRAVATLWIVQAVRRAPARMYDNRLGPYITSTVRMGIREYLQRNHIIRVPKDAWAKMIASLELDKLSDSERIRALKELKKVNMVYQASIPAGAVGEYMEDFVEGGPGLAICVFDDDTVTVQEIVRYLRLNYFEQQVLDMRSKSYTLQEIGIALKTSAVTIHKTLRKLQNRYRIIHRAHPTLPGPPDGI